MARVFRGHAGVYPDLLASGKLDEGHFFHRSVVQRAAVPGVVHNLAVAYVDTVVAIAAAQCDKVGARHRGSAQDERRPCWAVLGVHCPLPDCQGRRPNHAPK